MNSVKKIRIIKSRWDTTWYVDFIGSEFLVKNYDQWGHLYQVVNEDLCIDSRDCMILTENHLQPVKGVPTFKFN